MFRLREAKNWPSIQSLRYGFCRSSHGRGEQSLLIQRSSVCITVAFEMANLKTYNGNSDKSCESRCCSGATMANFGLLQGPTWMLLSGGSTKVPRKKHVLHTDFKIRASMNISIITACIPSMRPLFNVLQFSLIDSSIPLLPLERSGKLYPSHPQSSTEDKLISVKEAFRSSST